MSYQEQLSLFQDKGYREAYLETQVCSGIAYQVQALRQKDGSNQRDFAEKLGKPQSVVSRLENTEYGKVTIQTLLDVACALNIALVVKFVSYPKFLLEYEDVSPASLAVENIEESVSWAVRTTQLLPHLNVDHAIDYTINTNRNLYPTVLNPLSIWSCLATPITIEHEERSAA